MPDRRPRLVRAWSSPTSRRSGALLRRGAAAASVSSEDGDVQAAIIPASPNRSFFNSVFYEDSRAPASTRCRALADAYDSRRSERLDRLDPGGRTEGAEAGLEAAGHALDANPRAMGIEISPSCATPEPDPELEIRERDGHGADRAGSTRPPTASAPGDFPPMRPAARHRDLPGRASTGRPSGRSPLGPRRATARSPSSPRCPRRAAGGSPGACSAMRCRRTRAGQDGRTLIATKLGFPVYEKLGYRDVGGLADVGAPRRPHSATRRRPGYVPPVAAALQRRADRRGDRGDLRPRGLPRGRGAGGPRGAAPAADPRRGAGRRRLVRRVARGRGAEGGHRRPTRRPG